MRVDPVRCHARRVLAGALLLAQAVFVWNPCFAQAEAGSEQATAGSTEAGPAETLAEITVTGSRIRRDGFEAPTPTTVLDAEQIGVMAPNNLADAVNLLPALSLGLTPRAANLGTSTGTGGLNVLNLRGLGPTRTLVLLDGRRVAGSTSSQLVDINAIPQQLVERVEVVTGGASAAYGSDAVSGVVNFILDDGFTGLLLDAQSGITHAGDGGNWKVAGSVGVPFAGDRGHAVLSANLADQDGVFETRSRSWYHATKLVANPAGASPARGLFESVNLSTATGGGLIVRTPANGPLQGIQFGPAGAPSAFSFGTPSGTANLMIGGEPNDIAGFVPLSVELANRNVFGRLRFDIGHGIDVFAEGSYSTSRTFNPAVHTFKLGTLPIRVDNAFLPESIRTAMIANGLSQVIVGTWNQDIGKIEVHNDIDSQRYVVGLDAKLGATWTFNAYYQYGRSDAYNGLSNQTITARYNQAIDAIRDPLTGSIVCRDSADGCVPLNILGTGVASAPAIEWVTGTPERDSVIEQRVGAFSLQGEPLATPAGPVSIAFGAETRKESTREQSDPLSLASAYFSGNFKPTNGSYRVNEAFIESVVPLLRDRRFAQLLELNGAVRLTDYSTSGNVTTWKAGASYRPTSDVLLRTTFSRDIRAPNIADLFANTQVTQTVTDPFNGGRTDTVAAFIQSGNPDLRPEEADGFGAGLVYSPSWAAGLQASVDFYKVDIKEGITTLTASSQSTLDLCFQGISLLCGLITRDAAGRVTAIRLAGVNAATIATEGIDIELAYRTDLAKWSDSLGSLTFRALMSKQHELIVDTGLTRKDYAGEVAAQTLPFGGLAAYFPDLQGSLLATYEDGPAAFNLLLRYIGSGVVDNDFTEADISRNRVASVVYLNASASLQLASLGNAAELYFIVDNLLDKDPPALAPLAGNPFLVSGTSPGLYDTLGRAYRVGVRLSF